MKEELQSKLVEILTSIQTAAGKASDFAMEQLPDIAQGYVAYGRAYTTTVVVLCLMALAIIAAACYRLEKKADPAYRGLPLFISALCSILPLGFLVANFGAMFLVWFAPKVWLLKEIAGLLK